MCACCISKQRLLQPLDHHIRAVPMESPEGTWYGHRMQVIKQSAGTAIPYSAPRGDSGLEISGYQPRKLKCILNNFNEFRLGIFPHIEKHQFYWDVWFSLTVIFWCSDYLVFVTKTYISWLTELATLEQSLELCESLVSGLEVLRKSAR